MKLAVESCSPALSSKVYFEHSNTCCCFRLLGVDSKRPHSPGVENDSHPRRELLALTMRTDELRTRFHGALEGYYNCSTGQLLSRRLPRLIARPKPDISKSLSDTTPSNLPNKPLHPFRVSLRITAAFLLQCSDPGAQAIVHEDLWALSALPTALRIRSMARRAVRQEERAPPRPFKTDER